MSCRRSVYVGLSDNWHSL